jgi:HlyD family secretion protein
MSEQKTQNGDPGIELSAAQQEERGRLPAVIERAPPRPQRQWRPRVALLALLLLIGAGAGAGWVWWHQRQMQLPPGIASGNGRVEADEIDIDTKFAGRIAKLFVDEGEIVAAGQVVAMMDTRDLGVSVKKSEALVRLAQRALDEAKANLAQQQSQVKLAQQELDRTSSLVPKGFATVELLDQRRQQMNAAVAAENAASSRSLRRSTHSTPPRSISSTIPSSRRARVASSTKGSASPTSPQIWQGSRSSSRP